MNFFVRTGILLAFTGFYGCGQPAQHTGIPSETVKYEGPNAGSLAEFIQSVEVLPLRHENKHFIGAVDQIFHQDSSYYITDSKRGTIFRFNEEGKFLNNIGTKGKGPQEYHSALSYSVDEKEDQVYIQGGPVFTLKLFRYLKNGKWLEKKEVPLNVSHFTHKDHTFWVHLNPLNKVYRSRILRLDRNLQVRDSFLPLQTEPIPFMTPRHMFYSYQNRLYFWLPMENRLYAIQQDSVYLCYTFDFGNQNIPELDPSLEPMKILQIVSSKEYCDLQSFMENDRYQLALFSRENPVVPRTPFVYGIRDKKTGKWQWVDAEDDSNWYKNKIYGFDKNGRLICFLLGYEMEAFIKNNKSLVSNPEVLSSFNPEQDMFLVLCTLKR